MPYNTTAIPPRKEPTGQAQLPLSRVKKIIALDQDIAMCSNNAAFVITLATEMFIQYMTEQGYNVVKAEKKPRRNIQYRDLANAVSRLDSLEFLIDIVPRTESYKSVKARVKKTTASTSDNTSYKASANGTGEANSRDGDETEDEGDVGETGGRMSVGSASEQGVGTGVGGAATSSGNGRDVEMEDPDAQLRSEIQGRERSGSMDTEEYVEMSSDVRPY